MDTLVGAHWIALDLECLRSPSSCMHCNLERDEHGLHEESSHVFAPLGWSNKAVLGLSIGCYFDSRDARVYFFDEMNLEETMQQWVDEQPLIVTFNGAQFDLPLMRSILRRRAQTLWEQTPNVRTDVEAHETATALMALCDVFKVLCATSYDILAECWRADPTKKKVKGLHTLDSLAQANGYGGKTGTGAEAPRLWAAGRYAEVINYCAWDVELTRRLFEKVQRGEPLLRHDGTALLLPKAGGVA